MIWRGHGQTGTTTPLSSALVFSELWVGYGTQNALHNANTHLEHKRWEIIQKNLLLMEISKDTKEEFVTSEHMQKTSSKEHVIITCSQGRV